MPNELEDVLAKDFFERIETVRFDVGGVLYEAKREFTPAAWVARITATLGYMPFSAQAQERNLALQTIIAATQGLPKVRFAVGADKLITATADYPLLGNDTSSLFLFHPLTLFMQEARPFIDLIGRYF